MFSRPAGSAPGALPDGVTPVVDRRRAPSSDVPRETRVAVPRVMRPSDGTLGNPLTPALSPARKSAPVGKSLAGERETLARNSDALH